MDDVAGGKAGLIIGKQRHGPIGTVTLQFDGNVTRFSNYEPHREPEPARPAKPAKPQGPLCSSMKEKALGAF